MQIRFDTSTRQHITRGGQSNFIQKNFSSESDLTLIPAELDHVTRDRGSGDARLSPTIGIAGATPSLSPGPGNKDMSGHGCGALFLCSVSLLRLSMRWLRLQGGSQITLPHALLLDCHPPLL